VAEAHDVVLAETSSGPINVSFAVAPMAECRLQVSGGGIKVMLPKTAAVDVDARSSGGRVLTELPVTPRAAPSESIFGVLQGQINGGGPAVILRASSGDIHLGRSAGLPAQR